MRLRFSRIAVALLLATATTHAADSGLTRQQADSFNQKILLIADGRSIADSSAPKRTALTEGELNSWFAYHGQQLIPKGIAEPKISIVGQGRVAANAVVDLDAVAKRKATGGVLDPWGYVGGRMPVTVTGILHTKDGLGRFELESAEVSGVPVPRMIVQELVAHYSRTEAHPNGVNMEDPFELPAGIRRIEVGQGQAVVVQ